MKDLCLSSVSLRTDMLIMVVADSTLVETYRNILKQVNFTVCELYYNSDEKSK